MPKLDGLRRVVTDRDEKIVDAIYEAPGTTSVFYLATVGKRRVAVQFTVERSDKANIDALETAAGTIRYLVDRIAKGGTT